MFRTQDTTADRRSETYCYDHVYRDINYQDTNVHVNTLSEPRFVPLDGFTELSG